MTRNVRHCEPFFEKRRGNLCGFRQIFLGFGFCRNFGEICHFERSEKSIEFKARFNFMDTSLSCESSV